MILHISKSKLKILLLSLVLITLLLKENYNSLFIIIFFCYSIYEGIANKISLKTNLKEYVPFLLYFLLIFINLILSSESDGVGKYLQKNVPFLILPLAFALVSIQKREIKLVYIIFVLWIVLLTLYSHTSIIIQLVQDKEVFYNLFRKDYSYKSLAETIGLHPTYYSFFILIAVTICLNWLTKSSVFSIKFFSIVAAVIYLSFFIIHLSSRTNILVLIFLLTTFFFIQIRKKYGLIKSMLFTILSALIIITVLYNVRATRYRFQQIFGLTFHNGTRHDDGLNKLKQFNAVFNANNNFIWGNGIANGNQSIYNSYRDFGLDSFSERKYNAHNQYLQIYVEAGLIGLIVLLFIFFYYSYFFWKKKNILGLIFLIVCFILFLTESYLQRHKGIVGFTFFMCIIINYCNTVVFPPEKGSTITINNQRK